MDPDLPSRAIAAFEHATGLLVCFHDQRRSLWPYVSPERFEHTNPICSQVKRSRSPACVAFCAIGMRIQAGVFRDGVIKRCHAGIIELALPVFINDQLEWILFAGQRRSAPRLHIDYDDPDTTGRIGAWATGVATLSTIDDTVAQHQLENLRQLAARLTTWRHALHQALPAVAAGSNTPAPMARRLRILAWLTKHHSESIHLSDLAQHLELSDDRASHAVKEACGDTFVRLLVQIRLRTACGLLRFSDLPLREVARQSGFGTRAQFFAVFKADMKATPAAYRRGNSGLS